MPGMLEHDGCSPLALDLDGLGSRIFYRPNLLADVDHLADALEATLAHAADVCSRSRLERQTLNKPRHHARPQQSRRALEFLPGIGSGGRARDDGVGHGVNLQHSSEGPQHNIHLNQKALMVR